MRQNFFIKPEAFELETEYTDAEFEMATELDLKPPESLVSDVPSPGRYYKIQYGKGGLLTTTGRAYGLREGPERLKRAQDINNHPLNRKFWRPPANDFDRKYFREGIISFTPRFNCGDRKCFATIWIPPKEKMRHPQLGYGVAWPASFLRTGVEAVAEPMPSDQALEKAPKVLASTSCRGNLCATACSTSDTDFDISIIGTDNRVQAVDTTLTPHKWICHIFPFFKSELLPDFIFSFAGGTGFFVGEKRILTAAHLLHDVFDVRDAQGSRVLTAEALVIVPAQNGPLGGGKPVDPELKEILFNPFGMFVVKDQSAIHTPVEWRSAVRKNRGQVSRQFDYGLVSLTGAAQYRSVVVTKKPWPNGFWGDPATETVISTQIKRFSYSNFELSMAGYPCDKECEQWISRGQLIRVDLPGKSRHRLLVYDLDNARGMSGGPVWTRLTMNGREKLVLLGINAGMDNDCSSSVGPAITKTVWDRIHKWINVDAKKKLS